jgi:hypothetical protein
MEMTGTEFCCFWMQLGPKAEDVKGPWNPFSFVYRFLVGVVASLYYVLDNLSRVFSCDVIPPSLRGFLWQCEGFLSDVFLVN